MEFKNKEVENILKYLIPCLEKSEVYFHKSDKHESNELNKSKGRFRLNELNN